MSSFIENLKSKLKEENIFLTKEVKEKIEAEKEKHLKMLKNEEGKITIPRAKLEDQGYKDLGRLESELRGIMVKKKDYEAVKELIAEMDPSSWEDMAKVIKLTQATWDIYQVLQSVRSALALNDFAWVWDFVKVIAKKHWLTAIRIINAAEFIQQWKTKDFDIDFYNKNASIDPSKMSNFMKVVDYVWQKTDLPILKELKGSIAKGLWKLEKWQWETIMIPLKTLSRERKLATLKKQFPDTPVRELQIEAWKAVDDYFWGQQWKKLQARNPKAMSNSMQRTARISIFAPDLLISYLNVTGREINPKTYLANTPRAKIGRQAVFRKIVYWLWIVNALSFALNGRSAFENDDKNSWYKLQIDSMKDEKWNPYYADVMGNMGQTFNLINRTPQALAWKIWGIGRFAKSFWSQYWLDFSWFTPIPFNIQWFSEKLIKGIVGNEEAEFWVPEELSDAWKIALMEFFWLSGNFSSWKAKYATKRDVIEDLLWREWETAAKNFANSFMWLPIESVSDRMQDWIQDEEFSKVSEIKEALGESWDSSFNNAVKKEYNISSVWFNPLWEDIKTDIKNVKSMPKEVRSLFLENKTRAISLNKADFIVNYPKVNKTDYWAFLKTIGASENWKATWSQYYSYARYKAILDWKDKELIPSKMPKWWRGQQL